MKLGSRTRTRIWSSALAVMALVVSLVAPWTATAQELPTAAPWNGQPISPGLGPTYNEQWCAPAAPGSSIANQQGSPLALIPQEAVGCTLEKITQEGVAKNLPDRMDHFVIASSAGGRDVFGVVINALETPEQRRDYERWQQIRAIELGNPAQAQTLLASFGADVKMPVFIQANIHGDEEEGNDAIMQVIRDLVTTPRGTSAIVDAILDHVILIIIPMENPDGRFLGQRANANNFDMNRDWLVQSQAEVRASVKLQHQWLATAGLDLHGYVSPTLVDGTTKPHNPGLEYDLFLKWNQPRLDANTAALAAAGMGIQRPVNMWGPAGTAPGHPYLAEGWDDWGPFYTQTYMAFYGVDSSTVEMCNGQSGGPSCNGRLGSKTAQYVTVYSSLDNWIEKRQQMMNDQLEIFRRGVTGAARPACCGDTNMTARGFTEDQHNWMVPSPKAFVIPFDGGGQRSDGEANRLVRWLLDNGVRVSRATEPFTREGTTYPAGSYVVWMNQPFRGLALTALSAGQDISSRITQLYATPAAWSHGLLWGADVVEIGPGESFAPATAPITEPSPFEGGIEGGPAKFAQLYAVTPGGVSDHRAILDLVRAGFRGWVALRPFTTMRGDTMPAGSVLFDAKPETAAAVDAAGKATGLTFERVPNSDELFLTRVGEAPRVAILVNSASPARNDTAESLEAIFGDDAQFVSVTAGSSSLENAVADPLAEFDVIYNAGQGWPAGAKARERLSAFFARGGGYIGTSQSANNFSFLNGSGQTTGTLTQSSQTAYGGIAIWKNDGGEGSPLTGIYPSRDYLYLPSNITYFTATPAGAAIDGRYHDDMTGPATSPNGPSAGFVAGLWRTRGAAANSAPVIVRGNLSGGGGYVALATNPFSRQDAEREWALVAQAALWSNRTDETEVSVLSAMGSPSAEGYVLPEGIPAGSAAIPSVGGEWEGVWTSSDGSWGNLEVALTQRSRAVTGAVELLGGSCAREAAGSGRLAGPNLRFSAGGVIFEGVVEGGMVSGTFTDRCGNRDGTFEIVLENTRSND